MGATHSIEDDELELMTNKIRCDCYPSAAKVTEHAQLMRRLIGRSTKRLENVQDASLDRALVLHTRLIQESLEAKFYVAGDYSAGDSPLERRVLSKRQLLSGAKFDGADVIFSGAKCLLAFEHDFDLDPECRSLSAAERRALLKLIVETSKSFH